MMIRTNANDNTEMGKHVLAFAEWLKYLDNLPEESKPPQDLLHGLIRAANEVTHHVNEVEINNA